jgi:lysyl-tRNA synthetase class II
MFIAFNSVMTYVKFDEGNGVPRNYDIWCIKHSDKDTEQLEFTKDEINDIKKFDGIEKIYAYSNSNVYLSIPKEKLNTEYTDLIKQAFSNDYDSKNLIANVNLRSYSDSALDLCNNHLISGKIDKTQLDNMGVIIVNRNKDKVNKKNVIADFSKYKVGDVIKIPKLIPKLQDYTSEELTQKLEQKPDSLEYYTLKIIGILDLEPLNYSNPQRSMDLIVTENVYKKILKRNSDSGLLLKTNEKADRDMISKYFLSKQEAMSYGDIKQSCNYMLNYCKSQSCPAKRS